MDIMKKKYLNGSNLLVLHVSSKFLFFIYFLYLFSVKYFKNGVDNMDYSGARGTKDLVNFMKKLVMLFIISIKSKYFYEDEKQVD